MKISKQTLESAFEKISRMKILVIGDLILDEYLIGSVERISPEAPVPVVWVRKESQTLGGSGNVIKNLASLGISSIVFGRIGKDKAGETLRDLVLDSNVQTGDLNLMVSDAVPTICKTRIIASNQQVCRVDREEIIPLKLQEENQILTLFQTKIKEADAVILSDYDKGYFTPRLIEGLIQICLNEKKIVTVDPQVSHFFLYKGIQIMTPNHHEAGKAISKKLITTEEIESACIQISDKLQSDAVMITRGDKGMSIYESKQKAFTHIPTVAKEVFDVTGAGDTVITTYTAFLAAGLPVPLASLVSNVSAGIVVGKLGAATVTTKEILLELQNLGFLEGI